ncbi:MAG: diacylglycerol kinase family lipid kinase [Candidatus Borkfalkiaceae bacterium]|nr:diacylglycerol kinase family lipid kinase [Christensenellaceae bacterium]
MFCFIINPQANRGKAAKIAAKIKEILEKKGVLHAFYYTSRPGEGTEIAKKLSEEGQKKIVAVGGDGTVHEVFNGIDPENVQFGIIPCGSGNDFAATAKIPGDPEKAVELLLEGEAVPTDYMICDGVRGLNIIGTGVDVDILKRCRRSKILKGKAQYLISLIVSLIKFRFYSFRLPENGETVRKEALIACIGNGKRFGGGIRMCPEAEIDDGSLDFVVAGKMKKIRIPFAFVKLMQGKILGQDFISFRRTENVRVEFDSPVTIQIDGELYDGIDFDVSVVKGGAMIFRPQA